MSDLDAMTGKDVHELWRGFLKDNPWMSTEKEGWSRGGFKQAPAYHELSDDAKAAWDSLAAQLGARYLIDREFVRKMVRNAVKNYIINTLKISRGDIQEMIKSNIRDALWDWFTQKVDKNWVRDTINHVVAVKVRELIKERWTVNLITNVSLEEKKT